jgi:hypothetical protein
MSIYGRVTGAVQAGVTINLYKVSCGSSSLVATTQINADGYYIFSSPDGYYNVDAVYSGCSFDPASYQNVTPKDNVSRDFVSLCPLPATTTVP